MPERNQQQSEPVENFLKAVYTIQQRDAQTRAEAEEADSNNSQAENDREPRTERSKTGRVSTNTLSDVLNITAPSVTDMAQRLVAAGLIDYKKYHGVILTPAGEAIALRVIRRHRLIELYLVRELGYALAEVHDEAERLEHAVSDRFIEALARKMDYPEFDPHGDPIPSAEGTVQTRDLLPLTALAEGETAVVCQLKADDPAMLQFILDRGFTLDSRVQVVSRDPFEGPVTVAVDGNQRVIGANVAGTIYVERE